MTNLQVFILVFIITVFFVVTNANVNDVKQQCPSSKVVTEVPK